jgi:hypothetical protein
MATTNSTVYAKQISPTMGNRIAGIVQTAAPVRIFEYVHTMVGTEAAGDILNLIKLPQGAIIDPSLSSVVSNGIATTATIDIGDDDTAGVGAAADADRYADGLDVAAAGVDKFDSIAAAARLTPYALGADSIIQLTWATMNTPVAGTKLTVRLAYRVQV